VLELALTAAPQPLPDEEAAPKVEATEVAKPVGDVLPH
jgi:hypothetical protein